MYQFLFHLSFTVNNCGILHFHVVLKFTTEVAEDDTIFIIQNAIVDGKIGELTVNVSCIMGIPRFPETIITAPRCPVTKLDGLFIVFTDSGTINIFRSCHLFASCCFKFASLSLLNFQALGKIVCISLNTTD